jgi:hypothetical protein
MRVFGNINMLWLVSCTTPHQWCWFVVICQRPLWLRYTWHNI